LGKGLIVREEAGQRRCRVGKGKVDPLAAQTGWGEWDGQVASLAQQKAEALMEEVGKINSQTASNSSSLSVGYIT
jgi:hypothetical protein